MLSQRWVYLNGGSPNPKNWQTSHFGIHPFGRASPMDVDPKVSDPSLLVADYLLLKSIK